MELYFYVGNDGQQKGPVTAENLRACGVTKHTLVWRNGMAEWTKVADIEELAPYFAAPPVPPVPPVPAGQTNQQPKQKVERCPENYLAWAIVTTLLCCWPFGIPAIVNATKVDKFWAMGDIEGAIEKSKDAKKWCWISFGCAIAFWVIYMILIIAGIATGAEIADDPSYYYY